MRSSCSSFDRWVLKINEISKRRRLALNAGCGKELGLRREGDRRRRSGGSAGR